MRTYQSNHDFNINEKLLEGRDETSIPGTKKNYQAAMDEACRRLNIKGVSCYDVHEAGRGYDLFFDGCLREEERQEIIIEVRKIMNAPSLPLRFVGFYY